MLPNKFYRFENITAILNPNNGHIAYFDSNAIFFPLNLIEGFNNIIEQIVYHIQSGIVSTTLYLH